MAQNIELNVDGQAHTIEAEPDMPLLYALRDDLGLKNPRFGCGLSQCGACTVLSTASRCAPASRRVNSVGGKKVTTLNGIGTPEQSRTSCRPPSSRSRCRNAATASTAGS